MHMSAEVVICGDEMYREIVNSDILSGVCTYYLIIKVMLQYTEISWYVHYIYALLLLCNETPSGPVIPVEITIAPQE